MDTLDLSPHKDAAKKRRRSIYVYMHEGEPRSTIHLSMVPSGQSFIQVTKFGFCYRMSSR